MKCIAKFLRPQVKILIALIVLTECVFAQSDNASEPLEEVVVTGSYIKRPSQEDSASPIDVIDSEELGLTGSNTFADFVPTLTINVGDEGRSDNFDGPKTIGTSNINLRGLGVGANLVLLNGRRQTQAAMVNGDGESFVDLASLIPMIAVERVEILKDGASSLYGSEAISGVVNFITRDDFDGFEVELGAQLVPDGNQDEYNVSAIWGGGSENTHIVAALSVLERNPLDIQDRDLKGQQRDNRAGISTSSFGNPGNFLTSTGPVPDPDCDAVAAQNQDGTAGGTAFAFGNLSCRWFYDRYVGLVNNESRIQGFTSLSHQLGDLGAFSEVEFKGELGYARNKSNRITPPSLPPFARPVSVPAAHPQNPFGEDVIFLGRPLAADAPGAIMRQKSNTWRGSGVFTGEFADSWSFEVGAMWSENQFENRQPETDINAWQAAINDFSYNPFGNSHLAGPGDPAYNSQAVIDAVRGDATVDGTLTTWTVDAHVTGDLFEMPAGPLGVAIGVQYRDESIDYDFDAISERDGWASLTGNPDFNGNRDVVAIFGEVAIPLLENLDIQAAVRYEDYGGAVGSTTDPKVAALWQPVDALSLRASYSSSFRAPTMFQTVGVGTTGSGGVFALGSFQFPTIRFLQDPNNLLKPESADVYNIGASFSPVDNLTIDVDYWKFEFTDVIARQGDQTLANAAFFGGDPQALSQIDANFAAGTVEKITSFFQNAQGLDTDGIDIGITYGLGDSITLTANGTWVNEYTFITAGGKVKGAGFLNRGSIGAPAPEFRANFGARWATERQGASVYVRYIDSYKDQRPNRAGFGTMDSHTTVDAQYSFQLFEGTAVTVGARNIFDENVPAVRDFYGYDVKTHDARQRLVYLRLKHAFD